MECVSDLRMLSTLAFLIIVFFWSVLTLQTIHSRIVQLVRQIPYVREDTQFLINFLEEEQYKFYNVMDGPMGPYSTL
jgi:hypothetical protein